MKKIKFQWELNAIINSSEAEFNDVASLREYIASIGGKLLNIISVTDIPEKPNDPDAFEETVEMPADSGGDGAIHEEPPPMPNDQVFGHPEESLSASFDCISIKIASPEVIRSWSRGEVRKPETINYRTFKPAKDGLFCDKIFGPTRDWECNCGKYKRIKHRGIVCDRCGVEVTLSKVRRERMGHIDLAARVSHIWFLKADPSYIAALLEFHPAALERIIYYEEYVVIDPGDTPLRKGDLLSEEKYQMMIDNYGHKFVAKMGAEAIHDLLRQLDLQKVTAKYHVKLKSATDESARKMIIKNLRIVEAFLKSGNKPEWMILEVIPILPPDLRPLVPLEEWNFAASHLNDLYRRVINRNNRLRKLLELRAPEVIVRNEKRMLQECVDALFDNGRHGHPVLGFDNLPLESLSDRLKGERGRFRQALLGKRVDYSGRSVIVPGPELKLHQCGLPREMALELFEPFIIKKLRERGFVHTIKSAKRMIEKERLEVWDILEEVIKNHPVMLNRAPTLHRLGIQAFQPVLVEGKAIHVHPLVCAAFNADFDGDQMAVHVPISLEAQIECRILLLSSNNIFSPTDGLPLMTPSQEIVIGCYYLSKERPNAKGEGMIFSDPEEVIIAHGDHEVEIHAKIKVRVKGKIIETTVGRVIFNQLLPEHVPFLNGLLTKSTLSTLISDCYKMAGHQRTIQLLDNLKQLGFEYATLSGISISLDDLPMPSKKSFYLEKAQEKVVTVNDLYLQGVITEGERYRSVIDIWRQTTDEIADNLFTKLDVFNPIFMMADSGALDLTPQIGQLAGMCGLISKSSSETIESPIKSNFHEGLNTLEYYFLAHRTIKGLADLSLATTVSGRLTRCLVDAAQEVIVNQEDCGTLKGIHSEAIVESAEIVVPLRERIVGRVALDNVISYLTDTVIVHANQEITDEAAKMIEEAGIDKVKIRSVPTCESKRGVCSKCYGRNLATGRLVELGEAVGIIAAQAIGERSAQLAARCFDSSSPARRGAIITSSLFSEIEGFVKYEDIFEKVTMREQTDPVTGNIERVIIESNGEHHPQITILDSNLSDSKSEVVAIYPIPLGAVITVRDGDRVKVGDVLAKTSRKVSTATDITESLLRISALFEAQLPKYPAIISESDGIVEFGESNEDHLHIIVKSSAGAEKEYFIPHGKHLNVYEGDFVFSGQQLVDGPVALQDILKIAGERKLEDCLIREIQGIYHAQSVSIDDKHIEVIVRQMLRKVEVTDPGDSGLMIGQKLDRWKLINQNEHAGRHGKAPAIAMPTLLGVTHASTYTDSFISAASSGETTRVLTEAAASGKIDYLLGLNENVIAGSLIPAGTGFAGQRRVEISRQITDDVKQKAVNADNQINADVYFEQGTAKINLQDWVGAIEDFMQAIKLNPKHIEAYFQLGLSKANLQDWAGAVADFTKVIELDSKYAKAYFWRANGKYCLTDKRGALEDLRMAKELGETYTDEWIEKVQNELRDIFPGPSGQNE